MSFKGSSLSSYGETNPPSSPTLVEFPFELRNDLRNYLEEHHKAEIMGAGISISDFPVADISFKIDGKEYLLTIEEN